MIYIVFFLLSAFLVHKGCNTSRDKTRKIYFVTAMLFMAVFSGLRDYTVGTVTLLYGVSVFDSARLIPNFFSLISSVEDIEPGYLLLNYICAQFFSDAYGFFFTMSLLNYSILLKAVYDYKNEISPGCAWLIYCFLFFGDSLNIMRQSIAMAILLCGFKYIRIRNLKKFTIVVVIASTFHITALIGMVFYMLYILMEKKTKWIHYVWICLIIVTLIFLYDKILILAVSIGLNPKFLRYLSDSSFHFIFSATMIRVFPLVVVFIYWKNYKTCKEAHFFLIIMIMELLLFQMATMSSTFYRVSSYFGYYKIFAYSSICKKKRLKKADNDKVVPVILMTFMMLIFVYEVIVNNGNEIYPYTSEILKI